MFNYDALEALARVTKEQSFSKAAKALGITQPALSQKIRTLETLVGVPLLLRSGTIRPTEVGRKLIVHFHQVEQMEYEIVERISGKGRHRTPLIVPIALNTESLSTWFVDAIKDILRNENIALELYIDDQERTDKLLRDGKVVGCVTSVSKATYGCTSTYLGEMIYHLVATPQFIDRHFGNGVSAKTLMSAPKAIYGENDRMHEDFISRCFKGYSKGRGPRHYVPSPQALVEFAVLGLAYVLLPSISVRKYLDDGSLINLLPQKPYRLKLYWHAQDLQTEMTSDLCQCIISHARSVLD